jgi:hypothetical protein
MERHWCLAKEKVKVGQKQNMEQYEIDLSIDDNFKPLRCTGDPFRSLESLTNKIKNVPLTRGIGYRGWLRFYIEQVSQEDISRLKLELRLVDSLDGRHTIRYKKRDEQQWDRNFHIGLRTRTSSSN